MALQALPRWPGWPEQGVSAQHVELTQLEDSLSELACLAFAAVTEVSPVKLLLL